MMASSLKQPVTNFSAPQRGSASSRAPKMLNSSILTLGNVAACRSVRGSSRQARSLPAAAISTVSQSATQSATSTTDASQPPAPQHAAEHPGTTAWRRSNRRSSRGSTGPPAIEETVHQQDAAARGSTGPPAMEEPAQQQDSAVHGSTADVMASQGNSVQLESRTGDIVTADPLQQQQQQQQQQTEEARLSAALLWCARELAGRYKEVGDTEGEALSYLEEHGVRCVAHYKNNDRRFCFPGCTKPLDKNALVPAIEEQKRAGFAPSSEDEIQLQKRGRKRQSDAAGLRWCAQQLVSHYDGLGDSEEEALAFLEQKGVECALNRDNLRLFRFPGCDQRVGKTRLAEALGLQKKPTEPGREHLAAGLRWCAKQLVSDYQGVGDNQQQAMAFLRDKGVVCSKNSNGLRLFSIPGRTGQVSKDHLAAALGLQKKPELRKREETRQQLQEEGMVWLAEKFCNVYQIGDLEPGKASVEDVLAELRKMGVQCVCVGHYPAMLSKGWIVIRTFRVPGKIERCNAKALAKALRLKLMPGCTGTSTKHSASSSKIHERGMLWLATKILESPKYRHLFGGTNNPQEVSKELANKGVWCSPSRKPSGYFNWRFKVKGRPGKLYYKDALMQELFPEAFHEDGPEMTPHELPFGFHAIGKCG
ncbi:hypothetical protein DUNSADRAFT_1516 [Dunaliella salina]|uniref:Uncharacterized protein n=1 Tax=Dunaliella salina TaxID=3046 RepID=A0ABQ7GWX5_DUNSA|nr:hypothetical protein DUNSADRAFT_1516 [Dunaliella salina]|eukprot:KAF5839118.1 hypothetical protein DUNSADRAFT_1516 [Dunaliella salina]